MSEGESSFRPREKNMGPTWTPEEAAQNIDIVFRVRAMRDWDEEEKWLRDPKNKGAEDFKKRLETLLHFRKLESAATRWFRARKGEPRYKKELVAMAKEQIKIRNAREENKEDDEEENAPEEVPVENPITSAQGVDGVFWAMEKKGKLGISDTETNILVREEKGKRRIYLRMLETCLKHWAVKIRPALVNAYETWKQDMLQGFHEFAAIDDAGRWAHEITEERDRIRLRLRQAFQEFAEAVKRDGGSFEQQELLPMLKNILEEAIEENVSNPNPSYEIDRILQQIETSPTNRSARLAIRKELSSSTQYNRRGNRAQDTLDGYMGIVSTELDDLIPNVREKNEGVRRKKQRSIEAMRNDIREKILLSMKQEITYNNKERRNKPEGKKDPGLVAV